MHAVSGAPEIFLFINQVMLAQQDMATSSAAMMYNHFLHYTTQCCSQTFTSNTTSVNDKGKGKSTCGCSRSSQKGRHHLSGSSHAPKTDEDKNTIWCLHHSNWGSHFPSMCHLKNKQQNNDNNNNNHSNNTRG